MGVLTVRLVWYHFSECACVFVCAWEREIQNIKLGLSLGDGITYDFYSFLYTSLYLQIFFLYWVYITFIRKKKRYIFLRKKQTKLLLNAKSQQRTQGEQDPAIGLQKLKVYLTEWGRRQCDLYKYYSGSLLSLPWLSQSHQQGCSWTL